MVVVGGLGLWQFFGVNNASESVEVTNFEECVEAGNPVMESYPRQCRHRDTTYVEEIEENENTGIDESGNEIEDVDNSDVDKGSEKKVILCTDEQKNSNACTTNYEPVCGLVQIQCITTPCNPIPETFSNNCYACLQDNVISYTEGECSI